MSEVYTIYEKHHLASMIIPCTIRAFNSYIMTCSVWSSCIFRDAREILVKSRVEVVDPVHGPVTPVKSTNKRNCECNQGM